MYLVPWIDVMLQYSFHEVIFSFLIVTAYIAFPSQYCDLRSRRSSLCLVLLYLRLSAFIRFRIIVSSSVHQGTALCEFAFFEARCVLNDSLDAKTIAS